MTLTTRSSFGWLDAGHERRRQMLEVLDSFADKTTVDDLGIGTIRDALADTMFPGTSVLHTRLRYVLMVAWGLRQAGEQPNVDEMWGELRQYEWRTLASLQKGGEEQGVIGSRAQKTLQRMPSSIYSSALKSWGIRTPSTIGAYFQLCHLRSRDQNPWAGELGPQNSLGSGLDPNLPAAPQGLLRQASFALRPEESEYLRERIRRSHRESLFAWLADHEPVVLERVDAPWDITSEVELPEPLHELVNTARGISFSILGASLLYNLALAEKSEDEERADHYESALSAWFSDREAEAPLPSFQPRELLRVLPESMVRRVESSRGFLAQWTEHVENTRSAEALFRAPEVRQLISNRERRMKGKRARLYNPAALDQWSGASGTGRLTFRWSVVRQHLEDLYAAGADA
ncbi:DUF6361 family protein [Nesterenkonia sp. DZ6]|uniref:DUF6361 family protein n=1 Tax=Nesterenkonia sp. DZ6 TaxID=2901229 RepID=UPI001F4CFCDC|nr:DUF6361 family protein [Nesterenkonia sp. DZ6]MCH8559681.1 DUF6361 family protein [Nesterenkonia sp. DZ6]